VIKMVFSYLFIGMKKLIDLKKPEMSYLIGIFQTDGHLQSSSRNRGRLTIEISFKDRDLLPKLQKVIPVNTTIYTRVRKTNFCTSYTSTTLNIFNLEFRNEIVKCGVPYGKKSNIIQPPIVKYSENDYWRGIIDGDGSLGFTTQGFPFISLVTASENLYLAFKKFLKKHDIDINLNRNKRDNVYNIMLNKEKAQLIVRLLYVNSTISLKRKYEKALEILSWKRPLKKHSV